MKILFDDCYYFDYNSNDKKVYDARIENRDGADLRNQYKFNASYFNSLVYKGQYEDAARYAEKYHFIDGAKDDAYKRDIARLRREGLQQAGIKNSMSESEYKDYLLGQSLITGDDVSKLATNGVRHNMVVFNFDDGFSWDPNATSADKLISLLTVLGVDGDSNAASTLEFTFKPEVKKLFGVDRLAKDNPFNVRNFYSDLGMTEAELIANGVQVIHSDGDDVNGSTTIRFDKNNKLAYKLLAKMPNLYSDDGKALFSGSLSDLPDIASYDDNGNKLDLDVDRSRVFIGAINALYNKAITANNKTKPDKDIKQFASSKVGPLLTNEIYTIQELYRQGKISDEQYKYNMTVAHQHTFDAIRALGTANQKIYSNYNNENRYDESLKYIENDNRAKLQEYISYNLEKRPESVRLQSQVTDGVYGVLVTIDAHDPTKDSEIDGDGREINVFLPGFMSETVQRAFDEEPATRAINELNSINDYKYAYKLYNEDTISSNGDGTYTLSNGEQSEVISAEYAERRIHESLLVEDAKTEFLIHHTSEDGGIVDKADYVKDAKKFAIAAANEIYSELPEIGKNNDDLYDMESIFKEEELTNDKISTELYYKVICARNIYETLLAQLDSDN